MTVIKPENDTMDYRILTLENGLKVALVSDAECDKAAAALDVNVGYFQDPEHAPGLAHFLEHMCFYASEKYPKEDEFMKFTQEHGGSTNAYTTDEHTTYYFDINQSDLEAGLDRFSQFFVAPTISRDGVEREVNAVDSEHRRNLTVDAWGRIQVLRGQVDPSHPFRKFSTGSLETLLTGPRAQGVDIHAEVLAFYEGKYCASLMTLAVYGRDALDVLERWAREKFGAIKFRGNPRYAPPTKLLPHAARGTLVRIVPNKDNHDLRMYWETRSSLQDQERGAPMAFLGHVLGHEAEGSIFSALKNKGWAVSLVAGESECSNSTRGLFMVSVGLTTEGTLHLGAIVQHVLAYLALLQSPEGAAQWERIWREDKQLKTIKFHSRDKPEGATLVQGAASLLQDITKTENLLLHMYRVPLAFDPEAIAAVLTDMSPEGFLTIFSSKTNQGKTDQVEPIYSTAFSTGPLPLAEWALDPANVPPAAALGLFLPTPNPFVPEDLGAEIDRSPEEAAHVHPRVILEGAYGKVWYKCDAKFKVPKGSLALSLHLPPLYEGNAEGYAHLVLYAEILSDRLNEVSYQAGLAGLRFALRPEYGVGLTLSVQGYADKLHVLMEKVVDTLAELQFTDAEFAVAQDRSVRRVQNFRMEQPYRLAMQNAHIVSGIGNPIAVTEAVYRTATPAALRTALAHQLFKRVGYTAFAIGSLKKPVVTGLVHHVELALRSKLGARPLYPTETPARRETQIPPGDYVHQVEAADPKQVNSAAHVCLQVPFQEAPRETVLVQLLAKIGRNEAFARLRTTEQLGYVATLSVERGPASVYCAYVLVQSSHKSGSFLTERIEAFLESLREHLAAMTDAAFAETVEALAQHKMERDQNLWEERDRFAREIKNGTHRWTRQEDECAVLRKLTKQDLVGFFDTHFLSKDRRRFAFQIEGLGGKAAAEAATTAPALGDVTGTGDGAESDTVNIASEPAQAAVAAESVGVVAEGAAAPCRIREGGALEGFQVRARAARRVEDLVTFRRMCPTFGSLI